MEQASDAPAAALLVAQAPAGVVSEEKIEEEQNMVAPEPNEAVYIECYDMYRSWALQSIDIIKGELLSICFPLFAHWYVIGSTPY
jgi:hypothetical protein